jgi:hypothetical protein
MNFAQVIQQAQQRDETLKVVFPDFIAAFFEIRKVWQYHLGWIETRRDGAPAVKVFGYHPDGDSANWVICILTASN